MATKLVTLAVALPGIICEYAGTTAPTGALLCAGQAVSRTDYPQLFAVIGTTYGAGDGSTTFNIPDRRGRVAAGKDNMGGTAATRLDGAAATTLGGTLGAKNKTLTVAEMPSHAHGVTDPTHAHTVYDPGHTHGHNAAVEQGGSSTGGGGFPLNARGGATINAAATGIGIYGAATGISVQANGSGTAFDLAQPTIMMNFIIFY